MDKHRKESIDAAFGELLRRQLFEQNQLTNYQERTRKTDRHGNPAREWIDECTRQDNELAARYSSLRQALLSHGE
jgi:hypothetical protein